jgi:putative oxidoreductase
MNDTRSKTGLDFARWRPAIRWVAAIVFVVFGAGKFVNHASELASFRQYALPAPGAFVYLIGVLEIVGGVLLAAGLLVRVAAFALAADMVGAIVVSGIGRGEGLSLTLAPALLVAMIFLIWAGDARRSESRRTAVARRRK